MDLNRKITGDAGDGKVNMIKGKFYLKKTGCHLNSVDTYRIKNYLTVNQWEEIDEYRLADLIVFNTCAFIQARIEECVAIILEIQKYKKKDARFIICGCLPIIDKATLDKICDIDCLTPQTLSKLDDIIEADIPFEQQATAQRLLIDDELSNNRDVLFIRTNYGCLHNCSFCAVKKVFPQLKSKPIITILEEIKRGIKEGVSEIGLTSEDLTAYGIDIGGSLIELLQEIIKLNVKIKLSLYRFYPQYLIENKETCLRILESEKIQYLSIPINSGSNKILKRMGRAYDVDKLTELISLIKRRFSHIKIRSDIMVGHPGEEEADFQKTVDYIVKSNIDILGVFKFSAMPGTRAFKMKDQISKIVIDNRFDILTEIFENKKKLMRSESNQQLSDIQIEKKNVYFRVSKNYLKR